MDPADWPEPARPYFMLVVDTSGSMTACTTPPTTYPTECDQNDPNYQLNSCGLVPNRLNDAKCALEQTILGFSGQVNFGLSTYGSYLSNCSSGQCVSDCGTPDGGECNFDVYGCDYNVFPGAIDGCGNDPDCVGGTGPGAPNYAAGTWLNGGNVVVPMLQDPWWQSGSPPSNVGDLLEWMDGDCTGSEELFAGGATPIAGSLQAATQYLRSGWTLWTESDYCDPLSFTHPTPMDGQDRECRSVNILLVTDGDDNCSGTSDAVAAADDLYQNGVTINGKNWPVKTHVINFAGGDQNATDQIAAAGGTGSSLFATDEVDLAQALSQIITEAVPPEVCDNEDNNCNGCTDEGYKHYCNHSQTCCSWSTESGRDQCIADYEASVENNPPDGDPTLLPCITPSQQQDPSLWLCYDPGDQCDEVDNNCQDGVDENQNKCGSPLHCPTTETCNGLDDDCDNQVDEDSVCGTCSPSTEVCDGCDNDCDGIADEPPSGGFPELDCGLDSPSNCDGTRSCQPSQSVPVGTCTQNGGYGACDNDPQTEVCDGVDNDCDGQVDEGYTSTSCIPSSHPSGLDYSSSSQCTQGSTQCDNGNEICVGGTGPSTEVCDGVDNDCDGQIDESPTFGEGESCGVNTPPCSPGVTVCQNGALICDGGTQPQPEVCDGVDNDCDGSVDEAPLDDAPQPGQTGCWTLSGTCCSHQNLSWCPPQGASCHDIGTLTQPCSAGSLQCDGSNGWICTNATPPSGEVCDGIDNDCNGSVDDGNLPQVGDPCGTNVGICMEGAFACNSGVLDCVGDTGPMTETCNNADDDCNGIVDDGVPAMGPCTVPYDTNLYPGDRSNPPCQPGILECDGMGNFVCQGGVAPQPELCDGLDNDCDGQVDETGTAPDGVDGSENPLPPPEASIGDTCGDTTGACEPGSYACINGLFACLGGQGPLVETCDCQDNDCDGTADEQPESGEPPLCSEGSDCVKAGDFCQCAQPCGTGEFPCPPGQICKQVSVQGSDQTASYCIVDYETQCGDCSVKTVEDGDGNTVCGPEGTDPPGCLETPECVCKGPSGCQEPCADVNCSEGLVCSNFGPTPGTCVQDTCYLTGCTGCNKACHDGNCVDNPCTPDSCEPDEVCKPSEDFTSFSCVGSCADVDCANGEKCEDGACVPWCDPPCPDGEVCDPDAQACVESQCTEDSCPDGSYCDPLTGNCGDPPCTGIVCPESQMCVDGECVGDGDGGAGGAGGGGGSTGSTGGAETSAAGVGGTDAVFGQPTGGGGCSCQLPTRRDDDLRWAALLGLAGLMVARRRRKEVA